jgi:hypothetical protein
MSDPSNDAAVDQSETCCVLFLEWLASHGADTSRLQWPCFTWPGLPHDGVRGVAAKTLIDAGGVMFKIPGSLLIDRRTCLASDIGPIFLENPSLFSSLDEVALSLFIAYETFCRCTPSSWLPFIQNLPRSPGSTRVVHVVSYPRRALTTRIACVGLMCDCCLCPCSALLLLLVDALDCRFYSELDPIRVGTFARQRTRSIYSSALVQDSKDFQGPNPAASAAVQAAAGRHRLHSLPVGVGVCRLPHFRSFSALSFPCPFRRYVEPRQCAHDVLLGRLKRCLLQRFPCCCCCWQ